MACCKKKRKKGASKKRTKGKKLDTLGKVMSKVSRGMKLSKTDRKILSGAIDASKKARSER